MFYSHQLLARKAPLGQIWMAATMHAKINRRKLNQLDLVKICEEILNPSVPMALRLSGILMGGVVIVYERKVKLLYDDVTRLVVEINEAWKTKPAADPTILPKSKHKAKFEAVTMEQRPLGEEMMMTLDVEQTSFPHPNFLHMGLDSVGDMFININPGDDDNDQHHHQADKENITLDNVNIGLQETSLFSRDERFDHVMEEGGHATFSQLSPEVPITLMPSPPEPPQAGSHRKEEKKLQNTPLDEGKNNEMEQMKQNGHMRQPKRQKAKGRSHRVIMDEEQTIISGQMYQAWIRDASDIVSRRGRDRKRLRPFSMAKISYLVELPPVALISGFQNDINGEIHYPGPLLGLWKKFDEQERQSKHDPNRGNISAAQGQQSPPPTTTEREQSGAAGDFLFENFENGPDQMEMSIEGIREHPLGFDFTAPGSSGHSVAGSVGTASSGRDSFQMEREFLSSDKLKKRPQNFGNLDPVFEDGPMYEYRTDFKIRRVAAIEPTPEFDLLEETGPTPTLKPPNTEVAVNEMTRSIQTHFKTHFDEPGAPPNESLNQLAYGMTRRKAALLFYHTCVLATTDHLRVEQKEPYGEILISRGSKM